MSTWHASAYEAGAWEGPSVECAVGSVLRGRIGECMGREARQRFYPAGALRGPIQVGAGRRFGGRAAVGRCYAHQRGAPAPVTQLRCARM